MVRRGSAVQLIWATRFEESRTTKRQGSKGGPKVTEYSYFANVAFALCEGMIAGVRRIWADGKELDRETVEIRLHNGSEDQMPDPLMEAKQGSGNAPAIAERYVVFERLPIGDRNRFRSSSKCCVRWARWHEAYVLWRSFPALPNSACRRTSSRARYRPATPKR